MKSYSILLVDDNEVFRLRLGRALVERQYNVFLASDFEEGLASMIKESPEMAVIDQRMPERSGLELLQELMRIDETTKVVMLTGYGSISYAVEAVRLGAINYVRKPADADEILAAFKNDEPTLVSPPENGFRAPSLALTQWEHINRVLSDCGGNISETSRRLGIHRRSLQRKLKTYPPRE